LLVVFRNLALLLLKYVGPHEDLFRRQLLLWVKRAPALLLGLGFNDGAVGRVFLSLARPRLSSSARTLPPGPGYAPQWCPPASKPGSLRFRLPPQ